jgi:hypothetical protein
MMFESGFELVFRLLLGEFGTFGHRFLLEYIVSSHGN